MSFRVRSGKKGIALRLHALEATIMDIVWRRRLQRFCVQDVLSILERKREIAYTTVMTTLVRLYEKGLLHRERDGRRFAYSPAMTREAFLESTAREVLDGAVGDRGALALLSAKVSKASLEELDALEELIRRRREELEP